MGRRVQKSVYTYETDHWTLITEHQFLYDGWNLIKETTTPDGGSSVDKYYVWSLDLSQSLQGAGGVGGLLATIDGSLTYQYLYDANGNVGQLVDASDGSIAVRYAYDPYGNLTDLGGAYVDANAYRFGTKYFDQEANLYYYGYRYYSAEFGRWINRDLIKEYGGINLYSFVYNNALNIVDANGLYGKEVHFGLTLYLAIEAGLCPESAFRFAAANQSVDEGNTEPLNSYLEYWWKKPEELREAMQPHFPIDPEISSKNPSATVEKNSNYVNKLMSEAFQSGSLETVGRTIHTYQDSWSHQGYINQHGIPALTLPDDTSILERWRGRDLDMARHTYYELLILVDIKNNFIKDFDFCICEDPKPFPEAFVKRY